MLKIIPIDFSYIFYVITVKKRKDKEGKNLDKMMEDEEEAEEEEENEEDGTCIRSSTCL